MTLIIITNLWFNNWILLLDHCSESIQNQWIHGTLTAKKIMKYVSEMGSMRVYKEASPPFISCKRSDIDTSCGGQILMWHILKYTLFEPQKYDMLCVLRSVNKFSMTTIYSSWNWCRVGTLVEEWIKSRWPKV